MKPCTYCVGQNREEASFCGHCGQPFPNEPPRQPASEQSDGKPVPSWEVATLLSFLWPGVGQLYKGEITKAIAFCITHIILGECSARFFCAGRSCTRSSTLSYLAVSLPSGSTL